MRWIIALILLVVSVVFTTRQIRTGIVSGFIYEKDYGQLWELGVKSSTIQAKSQYVDDFYNALSKGKDEGKFAEYNAIWLQQPNNNFSTNLTVLATLSDRLREIKGMNPNSFEYNTAIQQITAQEQGEAVGMLRVFQGCYDLTNYSNVWGWHCLLWDLVLLILWILTIIAIVIALDLDV